MFIVATDSQLVGETLEQIFELVQPSPTEAHIMLVNSGMNTMTYVFEENDGAGNWTAMGDSGSDFNNALVAGDNVRVNISEAISQIRLKASASGGTLVQFTVVRLASRVAGGRLPILNV